jgi:DNA primase
VEVNAATVVQFEQMASSTTDLIKSKLDIVEFIRGYVVLTPAGKNFKGLCPFHKEKSPSFMVSPDRQSWHCFGCGIGGSVFDFTMKYENVEFGEALRILAEKAGVELRRENPAEYRYSGLLFDLNEQAKNYFRKALGTAAAGALGAAGTNAPANAPMAKVARDYLAKRGLTQATIDEFEIGWAPNEPEGLAMSLLNSGAAPQDLIQAGLCIKTERGLMLDRFRGRIMFPIHNHTGKVVGFTGRILPEFDKPGPKTAANPDGFVPAKYVNSPETPIFQKSHLLYGFWRSRDAIREARAAFLVEGQMDFLMTYQSGVRNVIASSGTALTADHLRTVHRLADELIVSFDNDTAGSDAAERGIELAEAQDFSVKVATITALGAAATDAAGQPFKDMADAALADPANVRKVYENAVPAPEFYFAKYLPNDPAIGAVNATALATREGLNRLRAVLAKLRNIASPVARDYWLKELARRTGLKDKTLEEEAEKLGGAGGSFAAATGSTMNPRDGESTDSSSATRRPLTRQELIVEKLFSAALVKDDFKIFDESAEFLNPTQKEILRILKSGKRASEDPSLDATISIMVLRAGSESDGSGVEGAGGVNGGELTDREVAALKSELAKEYYKERRKIIAQAIKNAEVRGNETELAAALEEMRGLPGTGE